MKLQYSHAGAVANNLVHQALIYLRKGALEEAKALMINGAFIHQCINTSIEYVKILCSSDASRQVMCDNPAPLIFMEQTMGAQN